MTAGRRKIALLDHHHALHARQKVGREGAEEGVITGLGGRTPTDALAAGASPKEVWAAVHRTFELPATDR